MRPAGPMTRPMTTAPRALSTRPTIAARATPIRVEVVPASQAPTLNRPQPAADTGPTRAPASWAEPTISSSRSGMNDSKVIMPIDQKTSASTMPMSTRLRPSSTSPLLMTAGVWRASPSACERRVRSEPTCGRFSRITSTDTTRCTTLRATDTQTATSSARGVLVAEHGGSRVPPDEQAGEHRPDGDRGTEDRAGPRQLAVDVGARGRLVHGVDEPRLERPGVQRPEGAHQRAGDDEGPEALGERVAGDGDDVDDRGGEVDRAAAHGIREAAGRQLEEEAGEAHDRADRGGLGDREAAARSHQDEDADDEADRQPAGGREQVEATLGARVGSGAWLIAAPGAGVSSMSSG